MRPAASNATDEELARAARGGSLTAFEGLVYRYEQRVYGFVTQMCGNATDAREVTQDTFVKAFRSIAQYEERHAFRSWLFAIARNQCIDHWRKAPRFVEAERTERITTKTPADELASQEDAAGLWETARRLLPALQFEALWLRYAEEMGVEDVSRVLRRTKTHVKVLLFRARKTLGRELQSQPERAGARSASPTGTFLFTDNKGVV